MIKFEKNFYLDIRYKKKTMWDIRYDLSAVVMMSNEKTLTRENERMKNCEINLQTSNKC